VYKSTVEHRTYGKVAGEENIPMARNDSTTTTTMGMAWHGPHGRVPSWDSFARKAYPTVGG